CPQRRDLSHLPGLQQAFPARLRMAPGVERRSDAELAVSRQLESVEHFADSGQTRVGCGHQVDVRQLVYVHLIREGREVAVVTECPACAKERETYVHPSDAR